MAIPQKLVITTYETLCHYHVKYVHVYLHHLKDYQSFVSEERKQGTNHELISKDQVRTFGHAGTNMVVDEVLWNWILVVLEEEAGLERFGRDMKCLAEFFYADDGLLMSTQAVRLQ